MESFRLTLALVVIASAYDPAKEANEFPYIVSIHRNSARRNYLCAGSLIAACWVLTTANCLSKVAYKIRYGDMITVNHSTYSQILERVHHINSRSLHHSKVNNRLTPKTNNIGLALIEEISYKRLGQLSAIDYTTLIGLEVTYFEFGFLPVFKARIYESNKNRITKTLAFKDRFRKIRESLSQGSEPIPIGTKVLRTATGVGIKCQYRNHPGPNICVAHKCFNFDADDPRETMIAPDYGAPLIYDRKIVGFTSEVEHHYLRFTPISPYLDWILRQVETETRRGGGNITL